MSIKERQRQGIEAARLRGKSFGRPSVKVPDNYTTIVDKWKAGQITAKEAMEQTGLKRTTFYKLVRIFNCKKKSCSS